MLRIYSRWVRQTVFQMRSRRLAEMARGHAHVELLFLETSVQTVGQKDLNNHHQTIGSASVAVKMMECSVQIVANVNQKIKSMSVLNADINPTIQSSFALSVGHHFKNKLFV